MIFHRLAQGLIRLGLTPNHVSVLSCVFGGIAGWAWWMAPTSSFGYIFLLIAFLGIQGRLICNLVDGLMAVEGGLKTKTGELFNEIPDRISDSLIFIGAGLSTSAPTWGWAAALTAMATAYIRVLGASMGAPHFFSGPMAKQHRMFVMTLALAGCAVEKYVGTWDQSVIWALAIITFGSLFTCANRLRKIAQALRWGTI